MQRVFVYHVDTPASQAVAGQFARNGNYYVTASLFDYSDQCYDATVESISDRISLFSQDDLYSDIFVEYLLQTDIFVLTPFDINLVLKLLQLIQQSCRSVRIVFLAPYLTLSYADAQVDKLELGNLRPCLPIYNTQQYLINKIDRLVHRACTTERQIRGQIVYYGMIYNSHAYTFNPFREICDCVKMTRLYPYFTNEEFVVPMTHSGRIAMYVSKLADQNQVVVDALFTYKQLKTSLQNGIFGYPAECSDEYKEQKPKTPSKAQIQRYPANIRYCNILGEIPVAASDYSTNSTFRQIIERLFKKEKEQFEREQADALSHYAAEKTESNLYLQPKSPARYKSLKALECEPEVVIFKPKYDFPDSPFFDVHIKDVISLYTYQSLLYTTPLKLPPMDDFSVYSFKAFLNYEKSEDPVIYNVQSILLNQMVTEIPQITPDCEILVQLYAFRYASRADILLCGSYNLNDLDNKLALFADSPFFTLVSPEAALYFISQLSDSSKQPEFWANYMAVAPPERLESASKGKKGDPVALLASDFLAFVCRVILAKGAPVESKNPFYDAVLQSFSGGEDAYLLAFAVALYMQFTVRSCSRVYYNFDLSDTTVAALNILKTQSFTSIVLHFINADFAQFQDAKKVPQPAKGFQYIGQLSLAQLAFYAPYMQKARQRDDSQQKAVLSHYSAYGAFADNCRERRFVINPLLNEIIQNGVKSALTARKETFFYYNYLAQIVESDLHISNAYVHEKECFMLDLSGQFSTLCSAIPALPKAVDVSAVFVQKKQLYTAYLMLYSVRLEVSEQAPPYPASEAAKKQQKDKNVVQLTQGETERNEIIRRMQDYNYKRVFSLLRVLGDGCYAKLLQRKPESGIRTLEQIFSVFGAKNLRNELLDSGIFARHCFLYAKELRSAGLPSADSQKSKNSETSKPQSELKTEKQRAKQTLQRQPSQNVEPTVAETVSLRPSKEVLPLIAEQVAMIAGYTQQFECKLQEAEVFYDYMAKDEAEQERQAKLRLYGIGESNFDNNSFGDMMEHSDEGKSSQPNADSAKLTAYYSKKPSKIDVRSSPKHSPKASLQPSPKASPGAKKLPGSRQAKDDKQLGAEQEMARLEQEAIAAQNARLEAEKQAYLEKQQKLSYYRTIEEVAEYLRKSDLQEDIAQALASLMLAIEAGMIGSSEQIAFLGEELLQLREEKLAAASDAYSQEGSNDGVSAGIVSAVQDDPAFNEMENCILDKVQSVL